MPKLFQINSVVNWGSTGKIAETIGFMFQGVGGKSFIAYGRKANSSRSELIKIGGRVTPYIHFAIQSLLDCEGLCSRIATKKLIAEVERIGPNIIQLHNIHDHYLNYKILFEYLNRTDIKVVWTFHDCWAFTGHCFHFVTKNCEKWKTQCGKCPLRYISPKALLDRSERNFRLKKSLFTANKNLTIVACSDWMANFVRDSFLKDKRIQTIHNGIDLNVFKPFNTNKRETNNFNVLAVSNVWHKRKGLYDIFELRKILPLEYSITIVGLSSKQVESLPNGINGIQRTQNIQELVRLYSDSDVFINPTYADTFPTVNLESLACGTPVITYNTGGSPEAIDEKTGVIIPQGDVNALAEAIVQMKKDPLSSVDCRSRAEQCFDKEKCFRQYITLYEELLAQ